MKKIDSHQHFWQYDPERYPWIGNGMETIARDFLPATLHPHLQAHEVAGTVAVQAVSEESETHFLLHLAEEYPFLLGVVGWVDLRSSGLQDTLHAYQPFSKLKGFRHLLQDEKDPDFILQPSFQQGLQLIFEAGYSYDLLVLPHQLDGAIQTVANFPEGRFVLDHLAKPKIKQGAIADWKVQIEELAGHPQVCCKVSGMVTEADWTNWKKDDFFPYLDVVVEAFGEDRLLFGSDWPVCGLAATYGQVVGVLEEYLKEQSIALQEKIWYENARQFYRL
ncbi:amidohydrolase family protein [Cyclobacterium xiamenense]|uniref:amidohydrolase family protein n=1 Tax=Cyclobacterium xiamenense TaxID=1297121 RepID=UPI0012B9E7F3|nr:amidohydrolase family protein [Cyclobacterium xiamenense]